MGVQLEPEYADVDLARKIEKGKRKKGSRKKGSGKRGQVYLNSNQPLFCC
jgi:hypothetical protein